MNFFLKFAIIIAFVSVFLGYITHSPIPVDVPDRTLPQIVCNYLSFMGWLGSVADFLDLPEYRWLPCNFIDYLASVEPKADDMKFHFVQLAGVETVIIIPQGFEERSDPGPAVMAFHGGGWVIGNPKVHMQSFIEAARKTGYVIVAPDYRKAPEHVFPIAMEDGRNCTIEFMKKAKNYHVDPSKVGLMGISAGANIALAVAVEYAKDTTLLPHPPAMLALIDGGYQMGNYLLPSHQEHENVMFARGLIQKFYLAYIGLNHRMDLVDIIKKNGHVRPEMKEKLKVISSDIVPQKFKPPGISSTPPELTPHQKSLLTEELMDKFEKLIFDERLAPLMASDQILSKLPRTHITVSEYDPLRDEGIILFERMKKLTKDVTFQMYSHSIHASYHYSPVLPNSYYAEQTMILYDVIKKHLK